MITGYIPLSKITSLRDELVEIERAAYGPLVFVIFRREMRTGAKRESNAFRVEK